MRKLNEILIDLLKTDERYFTSEGELLKNAVYEDAMKMDSSLIKLLLSDDTCKSRFFTEVDGILVFDKVGFGWIINNRQFLPDSYTRYKNRIGLVDSMDNFISSSDDVVLAFPYKDCVLEGGQTKEDQKRSEIFYNETLAPEEIDRLLYPKVFTNAKKYTANDAKIGKKVAENYDNQLQLELRADFQVFRQCLEKYNDSPEDYMKMLDALGDAYSCVGFNPYHASHSDIVRVVDGHNRFLLSSYHHKLPYVWICSVLFAHIMQRQNKIRHSDNLDITWASAYLPFVDYAVTDTAFCDLLNQSGLATQYGTKVYCFKTINKLLEEL